MKKILLSIATLGALGALVVSGTTAIFSDEEVSTGNTFTAGAIDLQIDNESYYNGVLNDGTTWLQPKDLEEGVDFFFNFIDLKPGDWGEDTISLHVDNNDSWLCVDVTLTSDNDNGCTDPEENDANDPTCGDPGPEEGELAENVNFIWWADDGDNVLEQDEDLLPSGPLGNLGVGNTATVALADSQNNIWGDGGPLPGDSIRYIGKAWCFGTLTPDPVTPGDNDPTVDPGFNCDGSQEDDITQTDSMTADLSFRAVQSRHNDGFLCTPPEEPRGTITVEKIVEGGPLSSGDFAPYEVGGEPVELGIPEAFDAGVYVISETEDQDYTASYSGACDGVNEVSLSDGQDLTCTITNTYDLGTLVVDKELFTSDGGVQVSSFTLHVTGPGVNEDVLDEDPNDYLPDTYTISESGPGEYDLEFSGDCTDNGDDTADIVLVAGQTSTCVLTNTQIQ